MSDEQPKINVAPDGGLGGGVSLLPNVLDIAKGLTDPDPTGVVPVKAKGKPKGTKAKATAAPAPKAPTVWETTPEGIIVDPTPAPVTVSQGTAVALSSVGGQPIAGWVAGGVYPINLPPSLHVRLRKPVTGVGGWQTLMGTLRECTLPDVPVLMLPHATMLTLIPKAVVHGSGGYQGVIRWVLCLLLEQHGGSILAPAIK